MSLTLVTNPVGTESSKIFPGFDKVEYEFKREDASITGVTSGAGGITVTGMGDLTSYLSVGDAIYVYSEGTNYTYSDTGTIISITSTEIVVDITFFEAGTGGYINYFKNYYVEVMLVDETLTDANILPFTLQVDGSPDGVVKIDVSIAADELQQRGDIEKEVIEESNIEFKVKYKQVYDGSSESYTLASGLVILVYATEDPENEVILNSFDVPKIYVGYPAGIVVAHTGGTTGTDIEIIYEEKNNNGESIASGTLGTIDAGNNGFLMWKWESTTVPLTGTKFIDFSFAFDSGFDFATPDFASPDFEVS